MLNMIKGCRIHDPSMLFEGYEQTEFGFVANVNADKIKSLYNEDKDTLSRYSKILYAHARLVSGLDAESPAETMKLVCELMLS